MNDSNHQRSLKASIQDGLFYSLMVGVGETYFSAYAIFLGANDFQLALLACFPVFMGGMSQFFTVPIMDKFGSRKKLVLSGVIMQAFTYLLIILAFLSSGLKLEVLITCVTLYMIFGQIINPIWNSWIGDLVPPSQRGIYFGKRNRVITMGTFIGMLLAGLFLKESSSRSLELEGFIVIFILAFLLRMISAFFISRKSELPILHKPLKPEGFVAFLKSITRRNEGRLILYMASIQFAVFLSAAYFSPYLIKTLNYDYFTYTFVIAGVPLTKFFVSRYWGQVVDHAGALKVVKICGFLLPLSTLPWIFTTDPWVLFGFQCFAGFMWAGYELSTFTFLLDSIKAEERARVTSYANIIISISSVLGGLTGAALVALGPNFWHPYAFIFTVTTVLRLIFYFSFVPKLKEVRLVAHIRTQDVLINIIGFRPSLGLSSRMVVLNKIKQSTKWVDPRKIVKRKNVSKHLK